MSETPEYGLVMPFVVVTSAGGPYDDAAFVAGYECGLIDATLHALTQVDAELDRWVSRDVVPQLDLIAMRHGLGLKALELDESGQWQRVQIGPHVNEPEDQ